MGPEGRQKYAADHADDPIAVSMALFVNNIAKEIKEGKRSEPEMPPPVVQQAIQAMNQPKMPQGMPPQGPPQGMPPQGMPPQGMPPQRMPPPQGQTRMAADGGYMNSRLPEDMGIGALPERSLANMADGGIVGYSDGGSSKRSKQPSFNDALDAENIQDPIQRAFLKALYEQESGSGANTTTSNQGAVGHMQIKPGTFKQVADKGMDINNAFDNMRAGIRYGMQGYKVAGGNPVLAGAYYYGGPGGMEALANGEVRKDPKNPKAPNTLEYGNNIAQRMTALLPIGTAQAETSPSAAVSDKNADNVRNALVAQIPGNNNYVPPSKTLKDGSKKYFSELTGNEQVVGAGEAALGLGTGLVDYFGSAAKGLLTGITGGDTQKAANESMGSLTYNPRSEAGQIALENSQKFLTDTLKLPPFVARIGAGKPYPTARFVESNKSVQPTTVLPTPAVQPTTVSPTPAVRTVPLPKQVAAGNPNVTTAKSPVIQPPVAQPRLEGLQRINEAKKRNAEIKLKAEQEAAAKAGASPPPNLTLNQKVVPEPIPNVEGGLPVIIKQTAAKDAAAKEAALAAAVKTENIIEVPKAPPRITYPNVITNVAKNAGVAATATNSNNTESNSTGNLRGKSGIADIDIGPVQKRPPFDRTSGDDTTHFPLITPEIAKTAVTLAQAEIPKKEQGGFSYEDLMMFGLQLMAGKSQYALQNVGEAGVATLTARQARAKAEADKRKSEAEALRDTAYSKYLQDKIDQSPEIAEDRRNEIENRRKDRADTQKRLREADEVAKQQKVDAALQKNPDYEELIRRKTIAGFNLNKNEKQIKEYSDLLQDINNFEYKFYKSRGIDTQAEFNPSTVKFVGFE